MLKYADAIILFMQDDIENMRNMKLLRYFFEQMSGRKINLQQSEVIMVMHNYEKHLSYVDMLNSQMGMAYKYLGIQSIW